MRFLNQDKNETLSNLLLLLTKNEAIELKDELERLIKSKINNDHGHVNDLEYQRELSLAIYDINSLNEFDENVRKLIIDNK